MRLTPWLSLFTKSPARRNLNAAKTKRRSRSVVDQVEGLEDRVLLSTFYVDNSPTLSGPGADVFTPSGGTLASQGGLTFGVDLFSTISDALTAANANAGPDDIYVADGTYSENISISSQVNLHGNNNGADARGRVATETIITPAVGTSAALTLQVGVAGSVIDGLTFSGGTAAAQLESTSGPLDDLQLLNNRFNGFTNKAVNLNDNGRNVTVNQNVFDGSSNTAAVSGIFHLDQDTFDGFYFTNNDVENANFTEGFYVDGNRNVKTSTGIGGRASLISGNTFNNNNVGANIGTRALDFATVSNNEFNDNNFDGLQGGPKDTLITQNTFSNNGRTGLALTNFGSTSGGNKGARNSVVSENVFALNIREDLFFSSAQDAGTISTNTAFNNSFGSTIAISYAGTETINASGNWFGIATASGVNAKIGGTGAANVDRSPFLNIGTDTDLGTAGFQGDFSDLTAYASGAQSGGTGRVTETYNLLAATGTIHVLTGTYTDNVDLGAGANKAVTFIAGASPGQVTITGNLTLTANDTLPIELDGTNPATQYDNFVVSGTVNLGGATLSVTSSFTPTGGTNFTIIDKLPGAITGTFNAIAEGDVITLGGDEYQLTYLGGDGNDVVLKYVDPAAPILIGTPGNDLLEIKLNVDGVTLETRRGGVLIDSRLLSTVTTFEIEGGAGNDTLTVDFTNGNPIPSGGIIVDGGTSGLDTLELTNVPASFTTHTYNYINGHDGSIVLNDGADHTISYVGLEPITNDGTADDIIFNLPSVVDAGITLDDLGGGMARLTSTAPAFEQTDFAYPAANGSITINLGAAAQTITVQDLALNATTALSIVGDSNDTVTFGSTVSVTITGALSVTAGTINQTAEIIVTGTTTLDAATGTIALTDVNNDFGGSVTVTNTTTLSIDDDDDITFSTINATGAVDIDAGGSVDFSGVATLGSSLDVDADANGGTNATITDTGAGQLLVTGTTTLDAGATPGAITLDNAANDFGGAVTITSATTVTIDDDDDISFSTINASGAVDIDAGGNVTFTGVATLGSGLDVDADANGGTGATITDTGAGQLLVTGTTTLDAGATPGAITLDNAANDFGGAVTITSATTLSIDDDDDITFSTINATGAVDIDAGGSVDFGGVATLGSSLDVDADANGGTNATITDTGAGQLLVTGTTTLDAGATPGAITLDNAANDFGGAVTITSATTVTIDDDDDISFSTINATGAVDIDAGGNVTFTGVATLGSSLDVDADANGGTGATITDTGAGRLLVTGTTTLDAGATPGAITLDQATNDFGGAVTITSATTLSIDDDDDITFSTINATGAVDIDAGGSVDFSGVATLGSSLDVDADANGGTGATITDTGAGQLLVTGTTTLDAGATPGAITLDNAANDFGGAVTITSATTLSIDDDDDITFSTINATGAVDIDAGGSVDFGGVATLGSSLDVDADANGGTNATITDTGAGRLLVTGTTTLDAGATPGAITLDQATNNFGGAVTITNATDASIDDANSITFSNVTTTGNFTVDAGGAVALNGTTNVGGNLDVQANANAGAGGAISGTGVITVTGTTTLETGTPATAGNDITLNNAANDFGGSVTITSANDASLVETTGIDIAAATVSNTLSVTSTGAITDSGNISVTNNASFNGTSITLGSGGETTNFGTLTFTSAGTVTIEEDSDMVIAGASSAGPLNLTANGSITETGTITAGATSLTGTTITLTNANVLGAVTITAGVGNVSLTEADPIVIAAITHTGTLTLNAGANSITQTGVINVSGSGATNLTGGVITLTQANVFGAITVNNGTGAVDITENATMDISAITHNGGNLTLQAGANTINVNGPIAITGGNADFLTTGTLNLNDNVTATVITGTPTIVNVNNNTAEIQDGVDAALAGATVNVNDNVTFSENVSIPKNLTLLATLDDVIIAGGAGGAALTVTGGIVSATGFYMNTASASSTVNVTGGSLTLRNNAIVESSGAAAAAITVGAGGALNMGVNGTSTPGNNSVTLSGGGTLLSTAVAVDASGNYWGSSDLATVEAGISPLASVDFNPYLNLGTNLVGIGFDGDFSDLSAHDDGSQVGVSAITEAYNMLTAVGTIHALTGSFTETVNLGAGVNKAVTFHAGASPGQVVISGDMILTANDTLPIELTGYVAPDALPFVAESTVSDNFTVTGTVDLGGATLLPIVTYAAVPFDRFTIINNLMADAVVGTFGGLPEGSIINVSGVRLRVSYVEFHNPGSLPATPSFFGDGNDVSLTVMTPPVLVELTTSGTLNITGTGWVDDFDLEVSGTNQITLIGNDVTNFQFGNTNTQILGPITVTGDINVSLGNSNDRVLLRGVGAGATFDSGNLNIELGSGNDSVSTTDITAPIVLTTGLTLTGDLSILGGTGDDVISLGGLAAADTFSANAISIDTGTGGIQSVTLDRTTVGTNVSLKNGGAGAQTVALGVNGPNSIGRDLVITQADGAASYTVGVNDTSVGRHLQITNGSGPGAAVVTVNATTAPGRTVGGLTQITNGNNLTNAVTLTGSAASTLQLAGSVTVKNGNATTSNTIVVTDVTDTGTTASSFTNGSSPANSITFNGTLANTFLGTVAATNGLSTGTNAITASRLSARGVTFKNGDATTSNTITLGGAAGTDTFIVAGNTSLTNGASADIVVNVDRLTANVPSGNVTIANGASGAGGTDVIIGAVAAANSITGNLTITNQVSTGTRTNTINNATVSGGGGLSINDFGSGVSAINIGTTALVTVSKKLDIQDGSSSATTTIDTATVGSMTYNDLGGGTDTINLANAAGTFQNNGVTRLNLGAGSDTVNIAIAGTAIFNDSVFISLGSGNDILNIGASANSPAFSAANRFQFDGGAGVDQITVSPLSIADYVVGNVPKKLKSKITNFESIL